MVRSICRLCEGHVRKAEGPWIARIEASILAPVLAAALGVASPTIWGHGGGLNASGCHNNRKTGDYHCHRGAAPAALKGAQRSRPNQLITSVPGQRIGSQAQDVRPMAGSGRPTCYVGPRGGTYTLTASGRKNYSGC